MEQNPSKSRLWSSILGYDYHKNASSVVSQIREGVTKFGCVHTKSDKYGNHYYVIVIMLSVKGKNHQIFTSWIDDALKQETRLTTLYPLIDSKHKELTKL